MSGEIRPYDSHADSGIIDSRGFCPNCGSAIYSTNSGVPGLVFVRASRLNDPEVFNPQIVVDTDCAVSWDQLDPSLSGFATMPLPQDMPG